jgi:GWxTD domain-containing protein
VFSQPRRENFRSHILLSEIYIIPSGSSEDKKDSTELLYYIYKIPYNRLVFEKSNNHYTAAYRLTVEVHDTITNTINRKIKEGKISVEDFEKTDNENTYAEGLLDFQIIKNKKYKLIPVLYDEFSDREIRLNGIPVLPRIKPNEKSEFLEPLIVNSTSKENMDINSFLLANYNGYIPFSKEKFDLLIPCSDTSIQKIYITLINNGDTVFSNTVGESVLLQNSIEESNGEVILTSNSSLKTYRDFIIPFVNKNLAEGDFTISLLMNKDSDPNAVFHKKVLWFNKPFSLINPELAIKFLKYMENDTVIDSLLDFKKDMYSKVLFNYWKRFDPTTETAFNELMNEYYSRIDYAMKNFSSITGKRGFDTDRGKIFILYGKPSVTERASNQFGKVVETWVYENPYRKFVFVDETGTGEYKLKNS